MKKLIDSGKIKLILIYILFVFINMSVNRLVKYFGLPLYVDNIGTLLGAILGGYLPGIFVGYITNIINSTADITNLYYAGISVLIASTASFFAKRGFYDSFKKALITIPFLAFMGGVVGSFVTIGLFGAGERGIFAQIGHDFLIDLVDKAITVVAAYGLMQILPKSFSSLLELTDWRQKPMTKAEIRAAVKAGEKGLSLRRKVVVLISLVMVIIAFTTTLISFILYRNYSIGQYSVICDSTAKTVAMDIDGDRVDDFIEQKESAEGYAEIHDEMETILNSAPYIEFVYVYKPTEDGFLVVFDVDTEETPASPIGSVMEYDDSIAGVLPDLKAGKRVEPFVNHDTFGWHLTGYEPINDSAGNFKCYACVDISLDDIRLNEISFLTKILSLFLGFSLLILTFCLWFADFHLTYPVDAMTFASKEFEYDSAKVLEEGIERLKSLDISTSDEIETLYRVLTKTISNTVGYLEDVKNKGEQIERMQNGLIYILADLVESRDKNTGDHVRKTAAYVKLILELLREKGLYQETITNEYIKDVYNSAPLHDVGKIKVPDAILNKPGRLTEEEFEDMKKHTTAGKEIIERAMDLVGDTGYLSEALNLATHHHEKWDGSGYPDGLKGEEIPLSARVMAVSDVFDALVSVRSYKKPFTFEKAMEIIEEGKGSHFDPVIAQVFLDNKDKVRAISEEQMRTWG